jgi:hypothetical protein
MFTKMDFFFLCYYVTKKKEAKKKAQRGCFLRQKASKSQRTARYKCHNPGLFFILVIKWCSLPKRFPVCNGSVFGDARSPCPAFCHGLFFGPADGGFPFFPWFFTSVNIPVSLPTVVVGQWQPLQVNGHCLFGMPGMSPFGRPC